jgi:hypothetical protein
MSNSTCKPGEGAPWLPGASGALAPVMPGLPMLLLLRRSGVPATEAEARA